MVLSTQSMEVGGSRAQTQPSMIFFTEDTPLQYSRPPQQPASPPISAIFFRIRCRSRPLTFSQTPCAYPCGIHAVDDAMNTIFKAGDDSDLHPQRELSDELALANRRGLAALHFSLSSTADLLEASESLLIRRDRPKPAPFAQKLLRPVRQRIDRGQRGVRTSGTSGGVHPTPQLSLPLRIRLFAASIFSEAGFTLNE